LQGVRRDQRCRFDALCRLRRAELKPTPAEQREIQAKLVAAERNQMIREIRAMTYQEARRFADSADKARLVAFAKGWRPGWVYYRVRELQVEGITP
jgi:hypothetical protein